MQRLLMFVPFLFVAQLGLAEPAQILVEKDFAEALPASLRTATVHQRTVSLSINNRSKFNILVHFDQLDQNPKVFRRVKVELGQVLAGTKVSASLGNPVNLGTVGEPVMALPILLQWSGSDWIRGEMWTLSDGKLKVSE